MSKIFVIRLISFLPTSDSTPELISIHQELVVNALSTFLELIQPERIKFCLLESIFLSISQLNDSPVPPYSPCL